MLVTTDQLELKLRRTLSAPQAQQAIEMAGGVVQGYCDLVALEPATDEITLSGVHGRILPLPLGPVTEVDSVVVDGQTVSDWWLVKDNLYRGRNIDGIESPLFGEGGTWGGPSVEVTVTYTHGLAAVPLDVQSVVLDLAAQGWSNPTGVRQQTIDGYQVTWGGAVGSMSADQKATLSRFHRSSRSADTS